jgi:hypothetical protein
MTERPDSAAQSTNGGEDAQGGAARDVAHAEGGRTRGETAVDEALGSGDGES